MEFITIEHAAITVVKKGFWKVNFKYRSNENYFDPDLRDQYESELKTRIFNDNLNQIVVLENKYPFNFGDNSTQYVIWIPDSQPMNDPSIQHIVKFVEEKFPDKDYCLYINKPNYRSIKSILHYHCIIKPIAEPFYLKRLIIINRHANRHPILRSKTFDKLIDLTDTFNTSDVSLLPVGHINSKKFGTDIKSIYMLNDDFLQNAIFLSSPKLRCRETLIAIIEGLSAQQNICEHDKLIFDLVAEDLTVAQTNDNIIKLFGRYNYLINKLEPIMMLFDGQLVDNDNDPAKNLKSLINLCEYYNAIQCYRDLSIEIIDVNTENELRTAVLNVRNTLCLYCQFAFRTIFVNLMKYLVNLDCKLLICATHDSVIFPLAKYLACINGDTSELELPHYLSNIRIEYWSDGITKIYYNNRYLGKNDKLYY